MHNVQWTEERIRLKRRSVTCLWYQSQWASQAALVVKNLPASAGDVGSIPGLKRYPGGGRGNPLQYSCLENFMDRGAWWASVHRVAKSQTRLKWLSMHAPKLIAKLHPELVSSTFLTYMWVEETEKKMKGEKSKWNRRYTRILLEDFLKKAFVLIHCSL